MDKGKKEKLLKEGWQVGSVKEFLGLKQSEAALIELKLLLSSGLRIIRKEKKITQEQFAKRIKSSQSRIAKMEKGDPSVSLDLLIKAIFALGANRQDIVRLISV